MDLQYYTFRIRITNYAIIQVERRGRKNEILGEPHGSFGYKINRDRIHELHLAARTGHLAGTEVQELGTMLFEALFDAGLRNEFFTFYELARREKVHLRVELDVDEREMPEIAILPWESMCIPFKAEYGTMWLATAPYLTFSRRRAHWNAPLSTLLATGEPLRIAIVVSAPAELGPVKYERIWEELHAQSKAQVGRMKLLDLVTSATRSKIDAVLEQKPHILHFIGHARLRDELSQETGQIALTDEIRSFKAHWIGSELFSELFTRHQPGIVLLQVCEGAALSSSDAFVGVASQVVQHNIPVVVSMQYKISNVTAQRFTLKFYEYLLKNHPIDKAVQEGRRKLALSEPAGYTTCDFAAPVLFMGAQDGRIFFPIDEEREQSHSRQPEAPSSQTTMVVKSGGIGVVHWHGDMHRVE